MSNIEINVLSINIVHKIIHLNVLVFIDVFSNLFIYMLLIPFCFDGAKNVIRNTSILLLQLKYCSVMIHPFCTNLIKLKSYCLGEN